MTRDDADAGHPYGLPMRRRLAAILALVVGAATLALAIAVAINRVPAWPVSAGLCADRRRVRLVRPAPAGDRARGRADRRRHSARWRSRPDCCGLGRRSSICWSWQALLVSLAAASAAFTVHVDLPSAPAPRQPVLFFNPRSGGGKRNASRSPRRLRERGIEPIELKAGDDLEVLVRRAVERGADGLAMAGGDGSQAIVAAIACRVRAAVRLCACRYPEPLRARPRR